MIRYTCQHEILPVIEGALAANGYVVDALLTERDVSACFTIMTNGDCGVLLAQNHTSGIAEIEIWGAAQSAASLLLKSLPLPITNATESSHAPC